MQWFTKEQLAQIVHDLEAITIDGLPVFTAQIINGATNEPIGLDQVRQSGMVYIKIANWTSVGNFAVLVEADEEE